MTDFRALTTTWQQLAHLAPEALMPIQTDEDLRRVTAFLRALDREMGEAPGHPLASLASSVMDRISDYEAEYFPIPDADGPAILAFLLDQHGLTQQQLAAATGISQPVLSQLLSRKRPVTAAHARALGQYFRLDAGVFL